MSLLRITNGFERLSDSALAARINQIIMAMKDNIYFTDPKPSLAVMQAAADEFSNAVSIARAGSTLDKAIKNDKRQKLIELVHRLSNYVLFIAEGDETIAISSAFTIAKAYTTSDEVGKPANLKLQDGPNAGELFFRFSKPRGAKSYVYLLAPDPITSDTTWQAQNGTACKIVLKGLKSCTKYWCKVVAIGVRGQAVESDVVGRVVQ